MHFEKPFKMHKLYFFPEKKIIKKNYYVPTLPKIFRPVTRNTHIFLFGLIIILSLGLNMCFVNTTYVFVAKKKIMNFW